MWFRCAQVSRQIHELQRPRKSEFSTTIAQQGLLMMTEHVSNQSDNVLRRNATEYNSSLNEDRWLVNGYGILQTESEE